MKIFFWVIGSLLFGFSLGWVNNHLGPNWFNLYLDLVILILSIGLFWKKTVWMVVASSITIVFLYLLDHQFSDYDNGYIKYLKPMYLFLIAFVYYLFFKDNGNENHRESAI